LISIHDPIHGTIEVSPKEIRIIDSRPLQRLRHIKQLGFGDLAFPGATHTRYAHSIGAMQMATAMADRLLGKVAGNENDRLRLRQLVRLAVLLHDIGHAPKSHVSERIMPEVSRLGLGQWAGDKSRQASHEDYTLKLILDSELTEILVREFGDMDIAPQHLAALIAGRAPPGECQDAFAVGGRDVLPVLAQIVSSEMDADRMDYLRRDAYYCGVSYGHFDHVWLTQCLTAVEHEGTWAMALQHRGVWAFENFLLARYHMFLAVYYHHTSVCFDHLLGRYFESGEYKLPVDSAAYLGCDDIDLMSALRRSSCPWAKAVAERRGYRLLVETHGGDVGDTADSLDARLQEAQIDHFRVRSRGVLSNYFRRGKAGFPLLVLEPELERISRIEDYTPLFRRFEQEAEVSRVYCLPTDLSRAREILKDGIK